MFRALTPIVAPPVVVVPAPTVIVVPASVAPVATPYADQKYREQFGDSAPIGVECEDKPYIQYKDEFKVFGAKATVAQMCQIKAGTTLACDRELLKITLVLKAADISVDGCPGEVTVGMTPEQVRASNVGSPRETKDISHSGKTTEQWMYEGFSVYFENGVVSAIQQYK